jgi:hypothetical protein
MTALQTPGRPQDEALCAAWTVSRLSALSCHRGALKNLIASFGVTQRNRYGCSSNGAYMLHDSQVGNRRGEELLDDLVGISPNLYNFDSDNDLEFSSTVLLLLKYWNDIKASVESENTEYRSEFIRILNKMAISHGTTNPPVACGARVVMCHVESSCLDDEEARLVQCITDIHIDRAASLIKAKSAA